MTKYDIISAQSESDLKAEVEAYLIANPAFEATGEMFFISPTAGYSQVVRVSSPTALPSGSATAANQVLEIAQLAALNLEATQLLIKAKTDNIDVAISTRLNTLGQKSSLNSAPVVIASDQSKIPVAFSKTSSYSGSLVGLLSAALATDIFTITGSATKVVNLKSIRITGVRTANGVVDLLLIKRSTANTLGTTVAVNKVPNDSVNAAATASVVGYTANPTLGVSIGIVKATKVFIANSTSATNTVEFKFDGEELQPITLRGITECFSVNLNGVTIAGGNFDISVDWTEE